MNANKTRPKSVTTTIRFDDDELEWLKERAAKTGLRGVTSVVRVCLRVAFGIPTKEEAYSHGFRDYLIQLTGVARNLNQMTRAANMGKLRWNGKAEQQIAELQGEVRTLIRYFEDYTRTANRRSLVEAIEFEKAAAQGRAKRIMPKGGRVRAGGDVT